MREKEDKYQDMQAAKRMKNELIPEEFPEGPYGSSFQKDAPVQAKSTPWEEGQYRSSAYVYPDKSQHDDLPRQIDGAHPLHDEKNEA